MVSGRTRRELLILLGGILACTVVILWGQGKAMKTEAAEAKDSPLFAQRTENATSEKSMPVPTYLAGARPSYLQSCWDWYAYQTYTFGWYLSTRYAKELNATQIAQLTKLFNTWLLRAFPKANRDYRSFVIVQHPDAITHLQKPQGDAEDIMKSAPFSKPLVEFGKNFSNPASFKRTIGGFLIFYNALPQRTQPVSSKQLEEILQGYGAYLAPIDDCVTINTAGARSASGEKLAESESCALVCGGIIISSGMTCGVACAATLGVTVATCSAQTCGAGAITCGNNVETCGATCGNSQTCLAVSCAAQSCSAVTCNGQTCGVGATCGSAAATCGAANTCGGATCVGACLGANVRP